MTTPPPVGPTSCEGSTQWWRLSPPMATGRLPDDEIGATVQQVVAARTERPDGPAAPLT